MPEFLTHAYVIWFAIGFCLALAELAAPGFIIIFFGLGCWVASLASAVFDLSLNWQISIFLVSSILSLLLLRRYFMRVFTGAAAVADDENAIEPTEDIGRHVLVTKTVSPVSPGEIKYRGSFWRALSDVEIPEGAQAVIVRSAQDDRSTFHVKPIESKGE
ncbi:MAG: NfeD family protein [Desulfovibrionaceae bacterium]